MKVIKIEKTYRGGRKINHLITVDTEMLGSMMKEEFSNEEEEDINLLVENWCREDLAGANFGYSYKWEEETDPEVIKQVVLKEIEGISAQIRIAESRHKKLMKFLGSLK